MTTYYLKSADEQAMWESLEAADLAFKVYDPNDPRNQVPIDPPPDWHPTGAYTWECKTDMLDQIGTIYARTGPVNPETGLPTPEPIDNFYYANLRDGVDIPELTPEQVAALPTVEAPASPYRKWAGDS